MSIGEFIIVAAPAVAVGFAIGGAWRGSSTDTLRRIVKAKDDAIARLREEADTVIGKNGELRTALSNSIRNLGRAETEIMRLRPLAEYGEQAKAQRQRTASAAAKAGAAKRQAKAAGNVEPIAKAKRKARA